MKADSEGARLRRGGLPDLRLKTEQEFQIHEAAEDIQRWVKSIKGLNARLSSHIEGSLAPTDWAGGPNEHDDVRVLLDAIDGLCNVIEHINALDIVDGTRRRWRPDTVLPFRRAELEA